jgi:hypothetical protein
MDYSKLSDFEINKLVAERLAWKSPKCKNVTFENGCFWVESYGFSAFPIESYCNNPSDAWPIIVENKISLLESSGEWEASIDFEGVEEIHGTDEMLSKFTGHKNPLRAAMIVYLMMQDN